VQNVAFHKSYAFPVSDLPLTASMLIESKPLQGTIKKVQLAAIKHDREVIARMKSMRAGAHIIYKLNHSFEADFAHTQTLLRNTSKPAKRRSRPYKTDSGVCGFCTPNTAVADAGLYFSADLFPDCKMVEMDLTATSVMATSDGFGVIVMPR
jgi:hypothetical protein